MSEMSEMWNISIKDQRQHYTQQCYSCPRCRRCEISQCYVITVLSCRRCQSCEISQYSNNIALRYFTSLMSPTWVTLLCTVLPLIFYWDISHFRCLRHEKHCCIVVVRDVFAHNLLNIQWIFNLKKVLESWALGLFSHTIKSCVYWRLLWSLTSLTYIALQPLGALDRSLTSPTCFNIHSIWWYGLKALSQLFKFFSDWKSIEY